MVLLIINKYLTFFLNIGKKSNSGFLKGYFVYFWGFVLSYFQIVTLYCGIFKFKTWSWHVFTKTHAVNMPVLIKCTSGCLCSSISNILRLEGMKELSLSLSNENNHFTLFIPVNSAFSSIPRARADTLFANSTLFQNVRDMLYTVVSSIFE